MKNFGIFTISGFNIRAVIALCRFCYQSKIPIHLVAKNSTDPIYITKYKADVFIERTTAVLDPVDFCGWLSEIKIKYGYKRVLIAPSSEFFNRFLLKNRKLIESAGGIIPLVDEELYESISDKYSFAGICETYGIKTPAEFDAPPENFPFVAKPLKYSAADGRQLKPYLLHCHENWDDFLKTEKSSDFYYQEFIHGKSFYLLLYISKFGKVTKYAQENLIQQTNGGSIILARQSDFHLSEESDNYISMLKDKKFFGLVMIEVRLCEKTGSYIMIEANPRMWGPIQFASDNGINLFEELVNDFTGEKNTTSIQNSSEYYFWSGGFSKNDNLFSCHNFDSDEFLKNIKRIMTADIFNREDTLALYREELKI